MKQENESQMKQEYEKLIAEYDKTLSMLRGSWMEAKGSDKDKYKLQIDGALDERMRLMKLRDGVESKL